MFQLAIKIFPPLGKTVDLYGPTNFRHEVLVIMQIMDGIQMVTEDLPGMKEVAEVGAGIVPAGVTAALFIDRPRVVTIAGVFDSEFAV
jgi:hypothetical protein